MSEISGKHSPLYDLPSATVTPPAERGSNASSHASPHPALNPTLNPASGLSSAHPAGRTAPVSHVQGLEAAFPRCLTGRVEVCLDCLWRRIDVCRMAFSQTTDIRVMVQGDREGERWLACFRVPTAAIRAWAHQPKAVINLPDWGVLLEARLLPGAERLH